MKDKAFIGIGGILATAASISIYNNYILPVVRHKQMIDSIGDTLTSSASIPMYYYYMLPLVRDKQMIDKIMDLVND